MPGPDGPPSGRDGGHQAQPRGRRRRHPARRLPGRLRRLPGAAALDRARTPPPACCPHRAWPTGCSPAARASTPTSRATASTSSASSSRRSDGNVGSTLFATHIGVAVCLRGDRAVDAVRFSYLHFKPACRDGRVRADARPRPRSPRTARRSAATSPRAPTGRTSRPREGSARRSRTALLLLGQDAGVDPVVTVDVAVDHGVRPLAARARGARPSRCCP